MAHLITFSVSGDCHSLLVISGSYNVILSSWRPAAFLCHTSFIHLLSQASDNMISYSKIIISFPSTILIKLCLMEPNNHESLCLFQFPYSIGRTKGEISPYSKAEYFSTPAAKMPSQNYPYDRSDRTIISLKILGLHFR